MPAAKFKIIRKCEVCGEEFYAKTLDSFYCSPRCSKIAYKRRKAEEMQQQILDEMVKTIPEAREYITVTEAHALFGISRNTVYRLIEKGRVAFFNTGKNQTRLKKDDLMKLYPLRETPLEGNKKTPRKKYSMEPEDCYTIGDISQKYKLDESTVYKHIRKYSIPTRQIGNFVYVPKSEIDELYKGIQV